MAIWKYENLNPFVPIVPYRSRLIWFCSVYSWTNPKQFIKILQFTKKHSPVVVKMD